MKYGLLIGEIGDPFPVKKGNKCCEICTSYSMNLDTVGVEGLALFIQNSIQNHHGPYLGIVILEGVASNILESLKK